MIFASVEVNTAEFEAALQRLRKGVSEGIIDPQYGTLPVQGRLLAERCQDFTPPRNVGQGKAAVTRDIMGIFMPLKHSTFQDKGIRKIVRTDDRPAWDKVAERFGSSHNLRNTKAIGFQPSLHAQRRNKRGNAGRIKYGNIGFVTLGPEGVKARAFLQAKKKLVGWARAGWNATILGLGGIVKGQLMAKHGMGHGRVINGTTAPDPFIQAINETGWAKHRNEGDRIVRNAVQARARDMQSYFERMMKIAAAKAMRRAA